MDSFDMDLLETASSALFALICLHRVGFILASYISSLVSSSSHSSGIVVFVIIYCSSFLKNPK